MRIISAQPVPDTFRAASGCECGIQPEIHVATADRRRARNVRDANVEATISVAVEQFLAAWKEEQQHGTSTPAWSPARCGGSSWVADPHSLYSPNASGSDWKFWTLVIRGIAERLAEAGVQPSFVYWDIEGGRGQHQISDQIVAACSEEIKSVWPDVPQTQWEWPSPIVGNAVSRCLYGSDAGMIGLVLHDAWRSGLDVIPWFPDSRHPNPRGAGPWNEKPRLYEHVLDLVRATCPAMILWASPLVDWDEMTELWLASTWS